MINLHPKSGYSWENFLEKDFFEQTMTHISSSLNHTVKNFYFEFYLHRDKSIDIVSSSISNTSLKKVLFVLCDEHNEIKSKNIQGYDFVFKTYLNNEISNFIPLQVGYNSEIKTQHIIPINNRQNDVFFSGNLNSKRLTGLYKELHRLSYLPSIIFLYIFKRPSLQRLINVTYPNSFFNQNRKYYISFYDGFNKGLSKEKYAEKLSESKIALCPRGFVSVETFRLHEALRQGCIVISERLPSHSFYNDAPFFQIDNWKNLNKIIDVIFKMDIAKLQQKCLLYYQEKLDEEATANYIIKHIIKN